MYLTHENEFRRYQFPLSFMVFVSMVGYRDSNPSSMEDRLYHVFNSSSFVSLLQRVSIVLAQNQQKFCVVFIRWLFRISFYRKWHLDITLLWCLWDTEMIGKNWVDERVWDIVRVVGTRYCIGRDIWNVGCRCRESLPH